MTKSFKKKIESILNDTTKEVYTAFIEYHAEKIDIDFIKNFHLWQSGKPFDNTSTLLDMFFTCLKKTFESMDLAKLPGEEQNEVIRLMNSRLP